MASRSGIEAGRSFVRMFLDDAELNAQLKGVQAKLRATGAAMNRVGSEMLSMGTKMVLPFVLALAVFVPFSDRMKEVQAVTQATGEQFDVLNAKAKELGRTTSFTAAEVAGAMAELGRAGFNPEQIEDATEHTLNLARASGTELPRAAEIMASTMNQFGKSAKDSQQIADVLTATVNSSAQGMEDLAEALKPVAPIAFDAGASLEETSAAIGILANNGIKGSLAGNSLARAYKNLADGGIRKRIEGLGVAVTDSVGNMRPLASIIEDIAKKTDGLGNADRLAVFEELFGRGSAAALKLASAAGGAFDNLLGKIEGWNDAAAETAQMMDSGIGGSFRRMMSSIEGVAIALAEAVEGPVTSLADKVGEISGAVTGFIARNRTLIVVLASLGTLLVSVGGSLIAVAGIIKLVTIAIVAYQTVTKAAAAAQAVLLALSGPKGWATIAAGVAIAGGAMYALSQATAESTAAAEGAVAKNEELSDDLEALKGNLDALAAGGAPNLAVGGAETLSEADRSAQRLTVTLAALRGETERAVRVASAGDALQTLALLGGNVDAGAADRVREMLEGIVPASEQLKRKLMEVDAAFALLERPINPAVRAQLQLSIIDQSTGAISSLRELRDEIAVLQGSATEAGQTMRDMLQKGVPPEIVERFRQMTELRNELIAQQEDATAAERERQQAERQRITDLRTKADQIRDQNTTAEERIELELADLEQLRKAIDPDKNTPLLDEETYRRELERLHQRQIELAGQDAQRINGTTVSSDDVRSVSGSQTIVDLINGRDSLSQQQLRELMQFNRHAMRLIEVTENTPVIKKVTG